MNSQTVCQRLQAHIESNSRNWLETYQAAEQALDAQVPGVPAALITAYYQKVQSLRPDMAPTLAHRDEVTLRAWAAAARPELLWNAVLLDYWQEDTKRLAHAYETLLRLYQAPADPALPDLPADDLILVQALSRQLSVESEERYPTGWAAVLVQEGSAASIAGVRRRFIDPIEDDRLDWDMDDFLRMVPSPSSEQASQFLDELRIRVAERNRRNGQEDFFRALGLEQLPETFALHARLAAKSGHSFRLSLTRQWRRSLVSWDASLGKQQASYAVNHNGVMVNKLKLPFFPLLQLRELMQEAAQKWKTRWLGPWEILHEEGFAVPLEPRLRAYFES